MAERGAFVGLDWFGLKMTLRDGIRTCNLDELVQAGYCDQTMMSHDHVLYLLGRMGLCIAQYAPNWTLTDIFERIAPRLLEKGLSRQDGDTILVDNPRRLFANAARQVAA